MLKLENDFQRKPPYWFEMISGMLILRPVHCGFQKLIHISSMRQKYLIGCLAASMRSAGTVSGDRAFGATLCLDKRIEQMRAG